MRWRRHYSCTQEDDHDHARPRMAEAFDKELLHLFSIDHSDAGMDEHLLGCYADLAPREAALAFGSDYDLERGDALWPRPRVAVQS